MEQYFQWASETVVPAGMQPQSHVPSMKLQPLIVHVVEQDIELVTTLREWYLDLRSFEVSLDRPAVLDLPDNHVRYLRMRVRADSLRRVMRTGEALSVNPVASF